MGEKGNGDTRYRIEKALENLILGARPEILLDCVPNLPFRVCPCHILLDQR